MDLKFTFNGGQQQQHSHDSEAAAPGMSLPFSVAPTSTSSVLELRVRRTEGTVIAEALSGDGVNYSGAEVRPKGDDAAALALAARSALARSVAGLEGPLAESVTAVVLDLGGASAGVLTELVAENHAVADPDSVITESLQRRIGIAAGTPIRLP